MPDKASKKRLGEMLIDSGVINERQLQEALEAQKRTGERLGKTLVKLGFIDEEKLMDFLGQQLGIPHINMGTYIIDPEVIRLIPEKMARKYQSIPLFKIENVLTVAMADPFDVMAIDNLKYITKCEIEPAIATEVEILKAIDQYYRSLEAIQQITQDQNVQVEEETGDEEMDLGKMGDAAEDGPVIKLVNAIIMQAIQNRASDIHIEPDRNIVRIRYRIDGVLREIMTPPKRLHSVITSRIKVMADLDIAEKRMPQDGRFHVRLWDKGIDFRVSTLPTINGEKIVMRILDKTSFLFGLGQLGFQPTVLEQFDSLIKKPYGIVLVTGPTGSGKTTSLYAALDKINTLDKNIITIEDPVEYELKMVNQVQVNTRIGLNFSDVLRSVLRQDPNVIMVGEIRDKDTADIAIRSALTGHLVFSTIHTNDAPGAITRLLDMGIEPFLISSGILGVLAQRLVRKLCPTCKEPYTPSKEVLERFGYDPSQEYTFYKPVGCKECQKIGYKGRLGIYEMMMSERRIRDLIMTRPSTETLKQAAVENGMITLKEDGLDKVKKGITSIEEVVRVVTEQE
ncbi:MAG: type II secretion system ATPase GspE [bacterium]|nr:type II secretion system ATPase GspE [bacterium]